MSLEHMETKILTLCCVLENSQILLGEIKKEGVLKGKYNGFGGKLEQGESIEEAAKRELWEEAGITPHDMKKRGIVMFEFEKENNPFEGKPLVEVHIFSVSKYEGEPRETEEMRPEWFSLEKIPYDMMWPDDKYWLPMLLSGKNFEGKFFLTDTQTIDSYTLKAVDNI